MKSKIFSMAIVGLLIGLFGMNPLSAADSAAEDQTTTPRVFVTVTGTDPQAQAMPLVLANQAVGLGATVRVLLCGPGAEIALKDHKATPLSPRNITPQDLLVRLLEQDVIVEVCAIFLPNSPHTQTDLISGVGIAKPKEVASWMLAPNTRLFTH